MPTIASFYGILVVMLFDDQEHNPPHVHVKYGEYQASVEIKSLNVKGKLPPRALKMVREWSFLWL